MNNAFATHGIDHLSASSLNTWVAEPALWVMERLLQVKAPVGVAAHRGKAAEKGIELGLFMPDLPLEQCQRAARGEFDKLAMLNPDPNRDKERGALDDLVETGLDELRQYGIPTMPPGGKHQHKIEIQLDDIAVPIIGYLDFLWNQHSVFIDLKTELRLTSTIKPEHARQVVIYQHALPDHEARVAYVSPKKLGVYRLEPEDARRALNQVRQIATRLHRFLSLSSDPLELAALLCPDPSDFRWNNQIAVSRRQEIYGY